MAQPPSAARKRHHGDPHDSRAIIEFTSDGMIVTANEAFLRATGYALEDIVGRSHAMFHDPDEGDLHEYRKFWAALGRGEFRHGAFKLIGKDGRAVWLKARYIPIHDAEGRSLRIVKFATLVSRPPQHRRAASSAKTNRTSSAANDRFLSAMQAGLQGS